MLMLTGDFSIGAGGSGELPTRCLDLSSNAPARGLAYQSAPSGFGSTTVQVGSSPPIPLQQALDHGVISIEGLDGSKYTKLRIRNLNPEQSVRVLVSSPTVLSPDKTYPSEDLADVYRKKLASYKHRQVNPPPENLVRSMSPAQRDDFLQKLPDITAKLDNQDIWRLRETEAAKALSVGSRRALAGAGVTADAAALYNLLVKRSITNASNPVFMALRNNTKDGPSHVILTGSGEPIVSQPYAAVGDALEAARSRWKATNGNKPLHMVLTTTHEALVTSSDLDVSYMLLAVAAGGGGIGGIIVGGAPGFPDPPEGWRPFAIQNSHGTQLIGPSTPAPPPNSGPPPGSAANPPPPTNPILVAEDRRGPYKYTEAFQRGEVTAYARREVTIATMATAIHRFLKNLIDRQPTATLSTEEVLETLKGEVEDDLDDLYDDVPALRNREKGGRPGAELEATVDGTRRTWVMANSDDASPILRFALSVTRTNRKFTISK
jgi:hypothetical protein